MKNYYEILEVNNNASLEIIKRDFKHHIKQNHPDLFEGESKIIAEDKIKMINEAYEVLSNEEKRKEYDMMLNNELENNNEISIVKQENLNLQSEIDYKNRVLNTL